jgi:Ran-binding protein 3
MAVATSAGESRTAESETLSIDPATPIAVSDEVPTAPGSPVDLNSTEATELLPDYVSMKSHARSLSAGSGSDSGDKNLKRKLADLGTTHGRGNGDVTEVVDNNEMPKRTKDEEDDNPRAKKRPTPPRTPEPPSPTAAEKRRTPPATPPSDSEELPKPVEYIKRPRDDADKDANPRQPKKPSPPPETKPQEAEPPSAAAKLVRSI